MSIYALLRNRTIHLHVTVVRPVSWPAGGHVVSFSVTGAASRYEVREILNKTFPGDALIRRFCPQRQNGEFSLFPNAVPPTEGDWLTTTFDSSPRAGQGARSRRGQGASLEVGLLQQNPSARQ